MGCGKHCSRYRVSAMRILLKFLASLFAISLCACSPSKSAADIEWSQIGVSAVAPRTLGVNAYLWQASIETFSFLPVVKADPYGGVIISDWYLPSDSANERMKVTVYIMDRALRADGLKVKVFRQERDGSEWKNVTANPEIERKLEDAILTLARQMRFRQERRRAQGKL